MRSVVNLEDCVRGCLVCVFFDTRTVDLFYPPKFAFAVNMPLWTVGGIFLSGLQPPDERAPQDASPLDRG